MIGNAKLSTVLRQITPDITRPFKENYVFEFLNLPEQQRKRFTKGLNQSDEKFHFGIG